MSSSKPPPTGPDQSRNEYIPSFISKRPFWADLSSTSESDYLEHQRLQSAPKDTLDKAKWYDRGKKIGPAATKYRKGACENCGAMTHKTKECLSRPRKAGAKWTGKDIQADEIIGDVKLGWDAKRDRWNGYDNADYDSIVREYEELEDLKKAASGEKDPSEGGDKYLEETDMGRSQPTSTRQLRLREDTAGYLKNLDPDSASYDPKTRTLEATASIQNTGSDPTESDFVRPQGDDVAFSQLQRYAWETQESSAVSAAKLHLQANPTEGEFLAKKAKQEKDEKRAAQKAALLARYGDAAATTTTNSNNTPAATKLPQRLTASEAYVEYDATGAIKGAIKSTPRSKYAEDVRTNNHTSVWGSWWKNFTWGYACCNSTVKNSYCTGEAGKQAFAETEALRIGTSLIIEDGRDTDKVSEGTLDGARREGKDIEDADIRRKTAKKRTLAEIQSGVTEEEFEAYKRGRMAADDPMARMLGKDELIDS